MAYALTEIVASGLESAAAEMCASLIRTAYSPNIKERADCSTFLCDTAGHTLALAAHSPAHLGSTLLLVPALLERFPLETMRPGDVFFANDPYIVGVTHLNDCTVAAPIFVDDAPVGFAAAVAHHSDVGGRVPGSESGDSTSLFQEGIRLPPVRLYAAGERREDIWQIFLLNSRTPHYSDGDLLAQKAAITRGIERMCELYARFGAEGMTEAITGMLDATERRSRTSIRERLSEGTYSAVDWVDEDGIHDDPVRLEVAVTVVDGSVHVDFSGCAAELPTGKNIPLTHTMATIYYCLKTMVDPEIAANEGLFRTVSVNAPEGSIVNPRPPAGVSSRNPTSMILADAIISALGQAAPSRSMAAGGPYQGIILGGRDPVKGGYFVDYENFAGGQGALAEADGTEAVQIHMTNTSNLPIEVLEIEFPLRVERYAIVPDSGGAGRYRGGAGICRDLRILTDNIALAVRSGRQRFAAQGYGEGQAGTLGAYLVNPGTEGTQKLRSTLSEFILDDGDLLRIFTPGGGGYGDPKARDPERVLVDVREGKVNAKGARELYGVAITSDQDAVDREETSRLRA